MPATCGLDWAQDHNDICIAEAGSGEILIEERFGTDEVGIAQLIGVLIDHQVQAVGIEKPDGLLVGRLIAAGLTVLAMHPNQVKAARDRFRAAPGKSDRFDARVLCELARTDRHRFPALRPIGDETAALRALLRTRQDLVEARVALANQLRAQLQAFWPGATAIFADVDSKIALAFIARYPTPAEAKGLGPKRLAGFLSRHGYCGRRAPDELIGRLRAAAHATIDELELEARRSCVLGLTAALAPIAEQITQLTSQIAGAIRDHPDGHIFLSFFRDPKSTLTAAGLLAEIGDHRARYPTGDHLAADAGMAPVAIESGKRRAATFRWACDKRLRAHFCVPADSTRHHNPWAKDLYQRARARGADHPHAIRILGRALARILHACWTTNQPYNINNHPAAQPFITQQG